MNKNAHKELVDLSAKKRELLNKLLQKQGVKASPVTEQELPLVRRRENSEETVALSFAQQRMWFLEQLDAGSATYIIPIGLKLTGTLNVSALHWALQELVNRHESLRTTFECVNGNPLQRIHPTQTIPLPLTNIEHLSQAEQQVAQQAALHAEAHTGFDLTQGPLFRASLLRLRPDEHLFLLTFHHILVDGWSIEVLKQELTRLYNASVQGSASPLLAPSLQYADYAIFQRHWLQGEVLQRQLTYWQKQLAGIPASLSLPTDHPRPAIQTYAGRSLSFSLPTEICQQLQEVSQHEGTTLFMTVLAAWQVLLHRYSGQTDIVVGTPIANRSRREVEGIIGCFVNTLALRCQFPVHATFHDILQQVREVSLAAYNHQDLPFEQVVEALQPQRDLSHSPLFQVLFTLERETRQAQNTLTGLHVQAVEMQAQIAKFDLSLSLYLQQDQHLAASLEYNCDLFEAETIERMSQHFVTLLSGLLRHPEQNIDQVPLLSQEEQVQLLQLWNATQQSYPADQLCLHQLVEQQVRLTPDAIALVFEQEQLSYQALDQQANRLAHALLALGIGPENRVCVCLERSLDLVIALYAILKAGAAYVPLDPESPPARLAFMVDDAQISVLLTRQRLATRFSLPSTTLLCLDTTPAYPEHQPPCAATADHLAYVIYTSGSTGRPKGVPITHANLLNLVFWHQSAFNIACSDRATQLASPAFDAMGWEVWPYLAIGASVFILANEEIRTTPSLLCDWLMRHAITITFLPTALAESALDQQWPSATALRLLLTGADTLHRYPSPELPFALINNYGPTEATVVATSGLVPPREGETVPPSIGGPVANTQIHILDRYLQPVPIGVAGELYIGGVGVGRGYLSRPALTAEKFVPDPFSTRPGSRLYRTSDLARFRVDGTIEYLGRIDFQVKLRGLRIELGEIEATLLQHELVQECVVIVHEDHVRAEKHLVAYLVFTEEQRVSPSELHQYLQSRLPQYMIPALFIQLARLPLNANGKLDRKALPQPSWTDVESRSEYVAPRTPIEKALVSIWTQVLGVEPIGIQDNFFALGGHSLLAVRMVHQIHTHIGQKLPLSTIFSHPTIAQIATQLGLQEEIPTVERQVPMLRRRENSEEPVALSFAQQRMWFLEQLDAGSATYIIPIGLKLTGTLNVSALHWALQELVNRHESLRTTFECVNGNPLQRIHPTQTIPLPLTNIEHLSQAEQQLFQQTAIHVEANTGFDLTQGPLFRTSLLRLRPDEHLFLLTFHHILVDGWSIEVLTHELAILYNASVQGSLSPLPASSLQYADYAIFQRHWLQGEALQRQLTYWQKQLAGIPASLSLPTDHPRPPHQTYNGRNLSFSIPPAVSKKLQDMSQDEGTTLFMTLLAAWQVLLHRYSGQTDIVVGTPIANRSRREVEGIIGCFVNTLALRCQFPAHATFHDILQQVREVSLAAYNHQDLPFEQVVEALQPQRDLSHSPLFQVLFTLERQTHQAQNTLTGLHVQAVEMQAQITKFDLSLSLHLQQDQQLAASLEYNCDLFEAETIERMSGHFVTLLSGLLRHPEQNIDQVPLLSKEEQVQLLQGWNATQQTYPDQHCLHQLVEQQVRQTPDAIALVFEQEQLSYHALDQQANRLAHALLALGIGPEDRVGVCLERSLDMVIALYAILKAGAAYVPLDPAVPAARLAFMVDDAQVSVLVTWQRFTTRFSLPTTTLLCLDTIPTYPEHQPPCAATTDHLAYVIYTSGSTGQPKGAMNTHRGIVNRLLWMQACNPLTHVDRVVQKTPFSFDVSVWEFFWPLFTGATLVLAHPGGHRDSAYLVQLIREHAISTLHFVPSMLSLFLEEEGLQQCGSIRQILCSGEALTTEQQQRFFSRFHHAQLYNLYGPTETAVEVTAWICQPEDQRTSVPIGRPIANLQIYILDRYLQPVPIGVAGELYIGGVGVGRGYLGRPALTAEKFVPDPFSRRPGERLYRTSDLARFRGDGSIEYLGRMDFQVKLRGLRIELGEIESTLLQHERVQECVVIVHEDPARAEKHLVAYLVFAEEQRVSPSELHQYLQSRLPQYMIPALFLPLTRMPLNTNGKLDRQALPPPNWTGSEETCAYVAPRTPIEKALVSIWTQVLGVEPLGIHDNFFALGGHSLLAVRMIHQIHAHIGQKPPLSTFFSHPTIAQIATQLGLQQVLPTKEESILISLHPGTKTPFFCVHPIGGEVFCYTELAHHVDRDRPFYGLRFPYVSGIHNEISTLEALAGRYVAAIQKVQPEGPYLLGGWSLGGTIAYDIARQLRLQGQEVAVLVLIDSYEPIRSTADLSTRSIWESVARALMIPQGQYSYLDELYKEQEVDEEHIQQVWQWAQQRQLLPPDFTSAQLQQTFETCKIIATLAANYQPTPGTTPITLLRASAGSIEDEHDNTAGWSQWGIHPRRIDSFAGDHYTILQEPVVKQLASYLSNLLNGS